MLSITVSSLSIFLSSITILLRLYIMAATAPRRTYIGMIICGSIVSPHILLEPISIKRLLCQKLMVCSLFLMAAASFSLIDGYSPEGFRRRNSRSALELRLYYHVYEALRP